mmetsp:Transcript_25986/g.44157  ORF Transcript_25986/g.44157 Transcript_25986/m.44157 type:complete len:126 (-) Transcript_25986:1430-1807(-)
MRQCPQMRSKLNNFIEINRRLPTVGFFRISPGERPYHCFADVLTIISSGKSASNQGNTWSNQGNTSNHLLSQASVFACECKRPRCRAKNIEKCVKPSPFLPPLIIQSNSFHSNKFDGHQKHLQAP